MVFGISSTTFCIYYGYLAYRQKKVVLRKRILCLKKPKISFLPMHHSKENSTRACLQCVKHRLYFRSFLIISTTASLDSLPVVAPDLETCIDV